MAWSISIYPAKIELLKIQINKFTIKNTRICQEKLTLNFDFQISKDQNL